MLDRSVKPGDVLPPLTKEPISKVQLVKYAGASGDYNLIHTDVETAREVGLDGVIAHGMLSMGFIGQFLTDHVGPGNVKKLKVRFNAMVRLEDVLTCRGVVRSVEPVDERRTLVTLEVWAENQKGEKVTSGEAQVWV